jgi:hypothetical protein
MSPAETSGRKDATALGLYDGQSGDVAAAHVVSPGVGGAGCDGLDESYGSG